MRWMPKAKKVFGWGVLGLLLTVSAQAQSPHSITVDVQNAVAPRLKLNQANDRVIEVRFQDGGTNINITGDNPKLGYYDSVWSTSAVYATTNVTSAANGLVEFTWTAAQLNTNGNFVYEAAIDDSGGNFVTMKQGKLNLKRSPLATGAGAVTYTTTINFDTLAESGLIDGVTISNTTYYGDGAGITNVSAAPTFDQIGDSAAATTIAFGDTEIVALDSSSDGEVFLTIDLLDVDLATDTTALKITSVNNDDANYIPLHIQDDSAGGTPDDLLKLDYRGVLTLGDGVSAAGVTIGSAALVEAELEIIDGLTATTAEIETLTDESNADALHGHSGVWAESGQKLSYVSTNTASTTFSLGNSSTMDADALVFSVTNAQNGVLFSIDEDGDFVMKNGITFSSSVFLSVYGLQATYGNIYSASTVPAMTWQDYTTDEADWVLSAEADDFIFTSDEVGEAMRIEGDTGYIGIGTTTPDETFEIEWAAAVDVEIGRGVTDTDQTFITLRSPDGTKYYIEVDDAGALSASVTKP